MGSGIGGIMNGVGHMAGNVLGGGGGGPGGKMGNMGAGGAQNLARFGQGTVSGGGKGGGGGGKGGGMGSKLGSLPGMVANPGGMKGGGKGGGGGGNGVYNGLKGSRDRTGDKGFNAPGGNMVNGHGGMYPGQGGAMGFSPFYNPITGQMMGWGPQYNWGNSYPGHQQGGQQQPPQQQQQSPAPYHPPSVNSGLPQGIADQYHSNGGFPGAVSTSGVNPTQIPYWYPNDPRVNR